MKRYALCTVILACVACYTSGCGKTDYNDFLKGYVDLKKNCYDSGGRAFKYENGQAICVCSNAECDLVCNENGKCHECDDGETRCENNVYQYCDGHIWHNDGNCAINPDICDNSCNGNTLLKCTKNKKTGLSETIEINCEHGCIDKNDELRCLGEACSDENSMKCNDEYLDICIDGHVNKIYCPFGCENDMCKSSHREICAAGEEKCEVNSLNKPVHYECVMSQDNESELSYKWEVVDVCPSNSCDVQKLDCGCADGEKVCIDGQDIIKTCKNVNGYAHWEYSESSFGCLDEYTLISCNNGAITETSCPFGCSNNACNECSNGDSVCNLDDDNLINKCVDGHWTTTNCEFGCNSEKKICYDCPQDNIYQRCSDDNTSLLKCENGILSEAFCKFGCSKDTCNECTTDAKQCSESSPQKIEICVDGHWGTISETCVNGCKNAKCTCEEDGSDCDGNNMIICKDGYIDKVDCPYGCKNGTCRTLESVSCQIGATKCEFDNGVAKFYECTDSMLWDDGRECETKFCDAKKTDCGCEPESIKQICENQLLIEDICVNEGEITYYNSTKKPCISPNHCRDNECVCDDDDTMCEGNHILVCKDGTWNNDNKKIVCFKSESEGNNDVSGYCSNGTFKELLCTKGLGCTDESGCNECVNLSSKCSDNGNEIIKCNAEHRWSELPTLCENQVCEKGQCVDGCGVVIRQLESSAVYNKVESKYEIFKSGASFFIPQDKSMEVFDKYECLGTIWGKKEISLKELNIPLCNSSTNPKFGLVMLKQDSYVSNIYQFNELKFTFELNHIDDFKYPSVLFVIAECPSDTPFVAKATEDNFCWQGAENNENNNFICKSCILNEVRCINNSLYQCKSSSSKNSSGNVWNWNVIKQCDSGSECSEDYLGCILYDPNAQLCSESSSHCDGSLLNFCTEDKEQITVDCAEYCMNNYCKIINSIEVVPKPD